MNGAEEKHPKPVSGVRLAPFSEKDRGELIALMTDAEVSKTYRTPTLETEEAKDALFCRLLALSRGEERFVRGIYADGEFVGMINEVAADGSEAELGYAILPKHKGRGIATAALSLAMRELAARGFTTVKAGAFTENPASIRVMQKCGLKATGETETVSYRGREHSCVYYAAEIPRQYKNSEDI